jgi:hypothetical protein
LIKIELSHSIYESIVIVCEQKRGGINDSAEKRQGKIASPSRDQQHGKLKSLQLSCHITCPFSIFRQLLCNSRRANKTNLNFSGDVPEIENFVIFSVVLVANFLFFFRNKNFHHQSFNWRMCSWTHVVN